MSNASYSSKKMIHYFLFLFLIICFLKPTSGFSDENLKQKIIHEFLAKMKEEPADNPILILLAGYQGTGKSTLAGQICKDYSFQLISKDEIRFSLFEKQFPFSHDFVRLVDEIYLYLLSEAINRNLNVIIDNNMHSKKIKETNSLLQTLNAKYQTFKILLFADENTLINRVQERKETVSTYRGTLAELIHALSSVTFEAEDYDLIIDTSIYDQNQTFEEIKMILN